MILVLAVRVVDDAWNLDKVSRDTVAPPELARDAPVLDLLEPIEPSALMLHRENNKLLVADGIA